MSKPTTFRVSWYQSIATKYLGPTNCRGSRIKATSSGGNSRTVPYDHSANNSDNHKIAAMALAAKMEWTGEWVGAESAKGYVFVCVDREN